MKTSTFLWLISAIIFFSCDDADEKKGPAIIGSWIVTSMDFTGKSTSTATGITLTTEFKGTGKEIDVTAIFSENPNAFTMKGSFTVVQTMTLLGQTTTNEQNIANSSSDGTWSLVGNELTMTFQDGPQTGTISEVTGNSFKFDFKISQDTLVEGFRLVSSTDMTYKFKRK